MVDQQNANQFAFWNTQIVSSLADLSIELTAYPIVPQQLQDAYDNLQLDLRQLESFKPTKKVAYEYTEALPNIVKAQRLMLKVERELRISPPNLVSQQPTTSANIDQTFAHRKIPELPIAKFDGKYSAYQSFIRSFHLKYDPLSIADAEKLCHLQASVSKQPLQLIGKFDPTDDNYKIALNVLEEQYAKKDRVLSEIHGEILTLKPATDTAFSLRSVYYELQGLLSTLQAHGEDVDSSPPLRDRIFEKYPVNCLYTVCQTRILSVTELQAGMANYITMREGIEKAVPQVEKKSLTAMLYASDSKEVVKEVPKEPKQVQKKKEKKSNEIKCTFCSDSHYASICPVVSTLSARKSALKDRCHKCFARHNTDKCLRTVVCALCKEVNSHHRVLCPTLYENDRVKTQQKSAVTTKQNRPANSVNFVNAFAGAHTTMSVSIRNPSSNRTYTLRALLDNGSNASYISERAAKAFGLQMSSYTKIPIGVFLNDDPILVMSGQTTAILSNGANFEIPISLGTLPKIPQDFILFDYKEFSLRHPEYAHLEFVPQADNELVDLVIGSDIFWHLLCPESKILIDGNCFLYKTEFGYALVGQTEDFQTRTAMFAFSPKRAFDKMCQLESIGITDLPLSAQKEEEYALQTFYRDLKFIDNHYQIRWPWRSFPPNLVNNYPLALGRLRSLHQKLNSDSFAKYDEIIRDQLAQGIIEIVPNADIRIPNAYYLPHRAVITPDKSTKVRIVYDGSARPSKSANSLNDVIHKGRNLLTNLGAVFIRFRFHSIAIVSDIEKAFLSLSIDPADRDYVRFIWFHNYESNFNPANVVIFRFKRVPFGVNASPFMLQAILDHHIANNAGEFKEILRSDRYADNFCTGVEDTETAIRFFHETNNLFDQCSMNIRSWATNDKAFREVITLGKRDQSKSLSVLGMTWNTEQDTIQIKNFNLVLSPVTLRKILSSTASFFDPCGLFSPIQVRAKMLFQVCQSKTNSWDEVIAAEHVKQWVNIQDDLQNAAKMQMQRIITPISTDLLYELHIFADASIKIYAAASYLRVYNPIEKTYSVGLLSSKTRIVKPETYSIPTLELLAVVLATRLLNFLRDTINFPLTRQVIWTDSTTVLAWIRNPTKILPTFIERRVKDIREISSVQFHHVPTTSNPADIPTRGSSLSSLQDSIWWNGPTWLASENWPPQPTHLELLEPNLIEFKKSVFFTQAEIAPPPFGLHVENFSELIPLLRVTAIALSFLGKISKQHHFKFSTTTRPLAVAELFWVRFEQHRFYGDILTAFRNKKKHDLIRRLGLFLDADGIIRCAHRLHNANMPHGEKYPILLSRKSYFTTLLIRYFHTLVCHQGTSYTLHSLRREYWIPQGRAAVSSIVCKCTQCKRFTTRPFSQPQDSQLPQFCLTERSQPFTHIGVDTLGPLLVEERKFYIILFVDLVCRAVDLEMLCDMTTEEFSFAYRRFVARRRQPHLIVSDNAAQFKLLREILLSSIRGEFQWKLIPEYSSWQGGTYERIVGITKQSLFRTFEKHLLSKQALSETLLRTVLAEIAGMLNSRPLTYVSEDHEDIPLCPNDFLHAHYSLPNKISLPENSTATAAQLVHIWKQSQSILDVFWSIWSTAYLQELRMAKRSYDFPRNVTSQPLQTGLVVLLAEPKVKRQHWRLGRIVKLNVSSDGQIRSADVQLGQKTPGLRIAKPQIVTRPLFHLYPLEISNAPLDEMPPPQKENIGNIAPDDESNTSVIEIELEDDF